MLRQEYMAMLVGCLENAALHTNIHGEANEVRQKS